MIAREHQFAVIAALHGNRRTGFQGPLAGKAAEGLRRAAHDVQPSRRAGDINLLVPLLHEATGICPEKIDKRGNRIMTGHGNSSLRKPPER